MTEDNLKTLKDIIDKEYQAYGLDCDSRKLKANAIKWVKAMPDDTGEEIQMYSPLQRRAIKDWISKFFNLTEEDLFDLTTNCGKLPEEDFQ